MFSKSKNAKAMKRKKLREQNTEDEKIYHKTLKFNLKIFENIRMKYEEKC